MSRFDGQEFGEGLAEALRIGYAVHELIATRKDTEKEDRDYDFWTIKSEHAFKEAGNHGYVVVLPEENQLLIDIDSPEALAVYEKNLPKFQMHVAVVLNEERKASRNGNTHIYVTLDRNVDTAERVMFQAFLGSDQTRELLSYVRIINDDPNPTLFIEKPTLLQNQLPAAPERLLLGDGNVPTQN